MGVICADNLCYNLDIPVLLHRGRYMTNTDAAPLNTTPFHALLVSLINNSVKHQSAIHIIYLPTLLHEITAYYGCIID